MKNKKVLRAGLAGIFAMGVLGATVAGAQYYPDRDYPGDYGSRRDYDDRYYGGEDRGSYDWRERDEARRLERERERLAEERARLDAQRLADEQAKQQQQNAASQQQSCPAGFQRSEQKCSSAERKRGCQDMRLPSGIGCVKR